jgi:hypothetical protein
MSGASEEAMVSAPGDVLEAKTSIKLERVTRVRNEDHMALPTVCTFKVLSAAIGRDSNPRKNQTLKGKECANPSHPSWNQPSPIAYKRKFLEKQNR